jgi:hypothetical protein
MKPNLKIKEKKLIYKSRIKWLKFKFITNFSALLSPLPPANWLPLLSGISYMAYRFTFLQECKVCKNVYAEISYI